MIVIMIYIIIIIIIIMMIMITIIILILILIIIQSNLVLWTPAHYYGPFSLSLGKESPYIFSKFNPLNTDSFYESPLSVFTEFVCNNNSDNNNNDDGGGGGGGGVNRALAK